MMIAPLWTILIPTIGRRADQFRALVLELLAQAEPRHGEVTVLAYYNNGEHSLGHIRQSLVEHARSIYVSFVDDDDRVPDYYVQQVRTAIHEYAADHFEPLSPDFEPTVPGVTHQTHLPDQVGWRMQHYSDGVPSKPTYHSIKYRDWWDDERGYYRDVSHLNPIRRELALAHGDFRRGDPPEDVAWSDQMRGHIKTEALVPDEYAMYHYHSSGDSTWRPGSVQPTGSERRVEIEHPLFVYHPDSSD